MCNIFSGNHLMCNFFPSTHLCYGMKYLSSASLITVCITVSENASYCIIKLKPSGLSLFFKDLASILNLKVLLLEGALESFLTI